MSTTEHRGHIYEMAVRKSGFSLTEIARRLKRHRTTMYTYFKKHNLSWDIILETGRIIEHDFSQDFKYLRSEFSKEIFDFNDPEGKYLTKELFEKCVSERDMWMRMYLDINAKYTELLEKSGN